MPLLVTFTAAASDEWGIASYSWDFGDSTTANGANLSHTYDACGEYIATLTVTDYSGNSASASIKNIGVDNLEDIAVDPIAAKVGQSVSFEGTATSVSSAYAWRWNFGDGSSEEETTAANTVSTSHTYNRAGGYTVTLTVVDDFGCRSTESVPVTVVDTDCVLRKSQKVTGNGGQH